MWHILTQTEFRVEKLITKQGDKLHFKSRDFDNLCSSWIDTKDIITKNGLFRKKKAMKKQNKVGFRFV